MRMQLFGAMLSLITFISSQAVASKGEAEKMPSGMDLASYKQRYGLVNFSGGSEQNTLTKCLRNWGDHPFKTEQQKKYREMKISVKVLGIGGDTIDNTATTYPQLILVKPSVKVLSKQTIKLMNPNGWYCFKSNVTVLSKSIIEAHCKANIAESKGSMEILGKNDDSGKGGVTVLGKSVIKRVGC